MTILTTTTCSSEGCPKLGKYSTDPDRPDLRGMCHDHQLASGGAGCDFTECDRPRVALTSGMCTAHARQMREGLELTPLLRGPKHGSATTYRNHKCRCEDCVTAWNKSCAVRRAKNVGRTYEGDKPHGSTSVYQYGCRCTVCKKGHSLEVITRRNLREKRALMPEQTVCDCCGKEYAKRLVTDHEHGTENIRGLLCNSCNSGLGKLGDNIEGIQNALAYLVRYQESL